MVFQELDCMEDLMWLLRVGFGKLSAPMLFSTFVERSVEFSLRDLLLGLGFHRHLHARVSNCRLSFSC